MTSSSICEITGKIYSEYNVDSEINQIIPANAMRLLYRARSREKGG